MQLKCEMELFSDAFDDRIFDLSHSIQKQSTYKQAKHDSIESLSQPKILNNNGIQNKPRQIASTNQILDTQSIQSVHEYFKQNVRTKKRSRRTKYPKRKNLANRSDVLNKCSIRKLRRRFWTMFRAQNNKMMNTRLNRVPFDKVYEAMKELLKQEYSVEELDRSMCIFIIGITKLKSIDSLNISSDIKSGVSIFSSC